MSINKLVVSWLFLLELSDEQYRCFWPAIIIIFQLIVNWDCVKSLVENLHLVDKPMLEVEKQAFFNVAGVGLVEIYVQLSKVFEKVRVKDVKNSILSIFHVF